MSSPRRKRHIHLDDANNSSDDDRKPPAKKKKKSSKKSSNGQQQQDLPDFFSVDLVATKIFSFLDTKELYAMSKTSKYVRCLIRHEHVVRSALMHGGHAQQSMTNLVELVRHCSIWTPTALRLLRLCNGRRCEHCNAARVNCVNKDYGLFLCWNNCITSNHFSKKVGMNKKWKPLVTHDRCAAATYSSTAFIFLHPFKDSCGDPAGPLITKVTMDKVLAKKTTLDKELEKLDQQRHEHAARHAEEIIATFENSQQEARDRKTEKEKAKEEARGNAIERKRENVKQFLSKLEAVVDDNAPWKQFALEHKETTVYTSACNTVQMKCSFTHEVVKDCLKAPSKATKKKIQGMKQQLEEGFNFIWENCLHNFEFMPETNEFEKTMKAYCGREFYDMMHIQSITASDVAKLKTLLQNGSDPIPTLLPSLPRCVERAVTDRLLATVVAEGIAERKNSVFLRAHALHLWRSLRKTTDLAPHNRLNACLNKFPKMAKEWIQFKEPPDSKACLDALSLSAFFPRKG
ncbi:expressed unknown protein [Seminavis robusta]|uniref:F-box domain-containing protein n=1 Tax=Seminavis robusta TaxID=568900 RepID=A0A9N8DIV7_9STRA|nr:expressed unknown protein [Seminavis robusta]|eukprot:Sro176_g077480.1 n/a (517) ;mRNA; r:72798-74348